MNTNELDIMNMVMNITPIKKLREQLTQDDIMELIQRQFEECTGYTIAENFYKDLLTFEYKGVNVSSKYTIELHDGEHVMYVHFDINHKNEEPLEKTIILQTIHSAIDIFNTTIIDDVIRTDLEISNKKKVKM